MTQALQINLSDPNIQQALGMPSVASGKRTVVQLAGDAPNPTGMTSHVGAQSVTSLTTGKQEVIVVYRGMFLTVDVYAVPGAPLTVHLLCPRCRKHATVRGEHKRIEFEPAAANPMRTEILAAGDPALAQLAERGRISIEAFECPWEIGADKHVQGGVHTGVSLCRLRIAIDQNRAKDA